MANGALHALALLLLAAALTKIANPVRAVDALRQARLPASPTLVRILAGAEGAVALLVLIVGGVLPALALAGLHVGFAAFIARLRTVAGSGAPCGCFGAAEAPADRLHVGVNLAAAAAALVGAAAGPGSLRSTLAHQPALGLPYLALVVVAAEAMLLTLTALPDLLAAERQLS